MAAASHMRAVSAHQRSVYKFSCLHISNDDKGRFLPIICLNWALELRLLLKAACLDHRVLAGAQAATGDGSAARADAPPALGGGFPGQGAGQSLAATTLRRSTPATEQAGPVMGCVDGIARTAGSGAEGLAASS